MPLLPMLLARATGVRSSCTGRGWGLGHLLKPLSGRKSSDHASGPSVLRPSGSSSMPARIFSAMSCAASLALGLSPASGLERRML